MTNLLLLLESIFLPLISIAATVPPITLPASTDYTDTATALVSKADFSTDPLATRVVADSGQSPLKIFIVADDSTHAGVVTYRVIASNTGNSVAEGVALGVTHQSNMTLQYTSQTPDNQLSKDSRTELMWFLSDILPHDQTGITVRFTVSGEATLGAQVSSTYEKKSRVAGTTHRILGEVAQATDNAASEPQPSKQPAIFCDPAETGCQQIFPNLGVNFQRVRQQESNPIICSPLDPRGCTEKRPTLGERFEEAVAVTEPGECRIGEDAIIANPAYHDSFLRQTAPAAAYMLPLFNSGQDFKRLVHQAILDSIVHNIRVRRTLFPIWVQAFNQHNQIIDQVFAGTISGSEAITQLQRLITQWSADTAAAQTSLESHFRSIRTQREERYDPIKEQAVSNTAESISLACGVVNGEDAALRAVLDDIKLRLYIPLLDELVTFYTGTTAPKFASLSFVIDYWENQLYPALRAYDSGNAADLQSYNRGRTLGLFDETFLETYIIQAETDKRRLENFRLSQWEIALDTPKTTATNCEFTNKVVNIIPPVETTTCESGSYGAGLARNGAETIKGQLGALQPPADLSAQGPNDSINPRSVLGTQCGGAPGDPYWAADCSCNCDSGTFVIEDPTLGQILACGESIPITRHDIFVTGQDECLGEPQPGGAFNPATQ